jgi:hypothetical protein
MALVISTLGHEPIYLNFFSRSIIDLKPFGCDMKHGNDYLASWLDVRDD